VSICFLYVGDTDITNCISRSHAYISRSTTSVFLNLWLWAAHDICDGNKKNRLKNTLLNTHTQILHAEQGMKHSIVRKVNLKSWFSSCSNDTDTMTKDYRVYHFPNKLQKHSCQPCNEVHISFSLHFAQIMMEDSILIHKWAPVL